MSAQLLEGRPVATQILNDVRARVEAMRSSDIQPGLATILVGDDPASIGYVRKKHEACAQRKHRRQRPSFTGCKRSSSGRAGGVDW